MLILPEHLVQGTVQFQEDPDWTVLPPKEWEARLREESPIVDRTSHLRFRWFSKYQQWALYECIPKHLLTPDRHEQLSVHWSELPTEAEKITRRRHVSDYQYWMYRVHGLEACPFLILQGGAGGTPAAFSEMERQVVKFKLLQLEAPALGDFPPCPFDERVIGQIRRRDRVRKAEAALVTLEKMNTKDMLVEEVKAAEREYRKETMKYLDGFSKEIAEYCMAMRQKAELASSMRDSITKEEHQAADEWENQYIECGVEPDGTAPLLG